MRSGLTPTKPESLGRRVPEKMCFGDQHGPLSNPGSKVEVPLGWAEGEGRNTMGPHNDFKPLLGDKPIWADRGDVVVWVPLFC